MRRIYISEMDPAAREIAGEWNAGVETIAFCQAENMENAALIEAKRCQLEPFEPLSLHAPYYELTPCAIDSMIGAVSLNRYRQAVETCVRLGIHRLIVHSGFAPQVYYPEWFVPKSISFWRSFAQELPEGFELMLENVLEPTPEPLCEVVEGVDNPRVRICLDVGHANAYSRIPVTDWIRRFGQRIGHVHLHNNDGTRDAHAPLNCGTLDMPGILGLLEECAPEAGWCVESRDARACMDYLAKEGFLDV